MTWWAGLVKTAAFTRKEVADVIRQPRLILMLVLGPFLILGLFGIGYQRDLGPMEAVLVVDQQDPALREQLERRLADISGSFELRDTMTDRAEATRRVRSGEVDVAVIAPSDPYATIRGGDRAVFTLLHDTLDPFERATVHLIATAAIDAVNREILAEIVATGQRESEEVAPLLGASRESASLLHAALQAGDGEEAAGHRRALADQLGEMAALVGPGEALGATLGGQADEGSPLTERLDRMRTELTEASERSLDEEMAALAAVEEELAELEGIVADLRAIEPQVLVSPLAVETELVGSITVDLTDFYAPGVIALLLQHLAITFASLSLVREVRLGTPEVFQVAPVGAGHILAGKYLGYLVWVAVVAATLSGLMLPVFDVPMVGSLVDYVIVLALLIVASLGVGFVVSSFVTSDTQAVNFTMIVLLLSIFFSGFFLSLDRLIPPVRTVGWLLPITHALEALRDVMFRGNRIDPGAWVVLGGGAVATYLAAWGLFRARIGARGRG